ncbi:MAG: hypothetical protein H7177_00065 [Rhizobacter sp.]|nr:hypothetical protein [Bacteriovorax sp.]
MSGAKKIETASNDQVNAKIQRKFDIVFSENHVSEKSSKNENSSMVFNDDALDFNTGLEEEFVMERNGKGNGDGGDSAKSSDSSINLDFSLDDETPEVPVPVKAAAPAAAPKDAVDGLDFDLDFNMDADFESTPSTPVAAVSENSKDDNMGFTLDDSDIDSNNMEFDEATKKTVMVSRDQLTQSNLEEFSLEKTGSSHSTSDLMSSEEAKANIESTIKDILRPKFDDTKDIDLQGLESSGATNAGLEDMEDSELSFRENTPSNGFALGDVLDDDAFAIDTGPGLKKAASPVAAPMSNDSTGEFNLGDLDTSFNAEEDDISTPAPVAAASVQKEVYKEEVPAPRSNPVYETPTSMGMGGSNITTEDSMRFQATIRALREEREEMLAQIKNLKNNSKELEQDNLTLKANLDEAKIEITILRKRHMVELEDIKYRLSLSDEKKAMADEKARQADSRREKLEQKVRIDFNQVKQREKELESKLELLSMDVDSQVQSRDQKILELRRKIDALEFNMENASIKEQKSLDDKRKLEDRLNKIMKTLRHSIKNLEDDIDQAHVDDDHQKEK